jgi:Dihydroorotase and related cyclic amidohydrolases
VLLRDIELVAKYGTRYHAQHISSKKCVDLIKEAKENNLPITSEVTPHHILENNENLDTTNGLFKMYPPIRTEEDRLSLIDGLLSNVIDAIATDHAPHPENTKTVDFKSAARGVVGLESAFPMLYSSGILSLEEIKKFMIENPRKILSEAGYKVEKSQVNVWQLCDKEFTTKSKFNNSIFEKRNTKIEKVSQNV